VKRPKQKKKGEVTSGRGKKSRKRKVPASRSYIPKRVPARGIRGVGGGGGRSGPFWDQKKATKKVKERGVTCAVSVIPGSTAKRKGHSNSGEVPRL